MPVATVDIEVMGIVQNGDQKVQLTVTPWLREVTQGEHIFWNVTQGGGATVNNFKIKDKGGSNRYGKNRRDFPGPLVQPTPHEVQTGGPMTLPSQAVGPPHHRVDGDVEDYTIELEIEFPAGQIHRIVLDPDYRVRP